MASTLRPSCFATSPMCIGGARKAEDTPWSIVQSQEGAAAGRMLTSVHISATIETVGWKGIAMATATRAVKPKGQRQERDFRRRQRRSAALRANGRTPTGVSNHERTAVQRVVSVHGKFGAVDYGGGDSAKERRAEFHRLQRR